MLHRHLLILLGISLSPLCLLSQNGGYSLFRSFTVAEGLPTNHVYNCVEDDHGFLWVATDEGIARFDGKYFQLFTTKDGLPDNEVLDVVKENNGRIWVNCFKQSPAYFDEIKNRFISARDDSTLSKITGTLTFNLTALKTGGVHYYNETGSYFLNEKGLTKLAFDYQGLGIATVFQRNPDESYIACTRRVDDFCLLHVKNGRVVDSIFLKIPDARSHFKYIIQQNRYCIVQLDAGRYYFLSDFRTGPLRYKIDSLSINGHAYWQRFTNRYFSVVDKRGSIFFFDKETGRPLFTLAGNYFPNNIYDDRQGNIWVCTIDKGLLLYKNKQIESVAIPDHHKNTHFLSIAMKPGGVLLAGNYYYQVIESDGKYFIAHQLPVNTGNGWIRKIIVSQNKVFSFSEGGMYFDFEKPILDSIGRWISSKTAAVLNDSIIITANNNALAEINTKIIKNKIILRLGKRTTALGVLGGRFIYRGGIDGLYRYDRDNGEEKSLQQNHPLLSERITAICTTPDDYIWIATASTGVLVLKNDQVVKTLSSADGLISNNIKCVSAGRPNEIWVGTNSGLTVISYNKNITEFSYQNLTINDGLSSNVINEMVYSNDTMYCATGNGILAIPASIRLPALNIPVRLLSVTINGRDTSVSSKYNLSHRQKNIELHLAGIELGGHFNYFQYSIDGSGWQSFSGNILTLRLNSGEHRISVRAVDVNGNVGATPLIVSFSISTFFLNSLWFWVSLTILSVGLVAWFLRKKEIQKRERELQSMLNQKRLTELELQALKSQINPHFIFNCLNSIKLLNHQQKHTQVESYLDRFAALLRSALEQSSLMYISLRQEMDFIENYLSLEQLRFPDKLSFKVEAEPDLDPVRIRIPSMMLQPHVENAVKHGIAPLNHRPGQVLVKFYKKEQRLVAEIRDNGIGIDKETGSPGGIGIGIENTERRSRLYNIETLITDLKGQGGNEEGTLIQLIIPLQST